MTNDEIKELIQKIEELNKTQVNTQSKIHESITSLEKTYAHSIKQVYRARNDEYAIRLILSFIFATILGIWALGLPWYLGLSFGILIPATFVRL